jgi:hypothetical protein
MFLVSIFAYENIRKWKQELIPQSHALFTDLPEAVTANSADNRWQINKRKTNIEHPDSIDRQPNGRTANKETGMNKELFPHSDSMKRYSNSRSATKETG